MFTGFYNLTIDDHMLAQWAKLINDMGVEQQSLTIMQMILQFILDKFLQLVQNYEIVFFRRLPTLRKMM